MNDNNNSNENQSFNSPFYIPSEEKNKWKKNALYSYILVAVISSIVGGCMVGFFFLFAKPVVEPVVGKVVGQLFPRLASKVITTPNMTTSNITNSSTLKKAESEEYSSPVVSIAEKAGPTIVGIKVTYNELSPFSFFGDSTKSEAQGEGSGIIVRKDGYILTNYHVIENAYSQSDKKQTGKIEVYLPNNSKKPISAKVIGGDKTSDLAIIKIDEDNLPEAELGDSSTLKVGELAVAIGNPLGMEFAGSVTSGVISAVNRGIEVTDNITKSKRTLNVIQTDAAINPGNSGGALVNSNGQVIGVNTIKMASTGVEGLGFAIPINVVKPIMEQLIKYSYVKGRPQVGIGGVNVDERASQQYDIPIGVYVQQITPFSGAERAGIQIGDVIVEFAGKPIKTIEELNDIKKDYKPEDIVKVVIVRDGVRKTLNLKLTEDK
jgi:serine protease Do